MYLAYAQPGFAQPHVSSPSLSYLRPTDQVSYAANALFQPRALFEDTHLTFPPPTQRSRQIPEVTSYTPNEGPQGTQLFVHLLSAYDVEAAQPSLEFLVMFASRPCQPILTKIDLQGTYHQYMLTVDAPPFSATRWTGSQVPLRLQVQDATGSNVGVLDVGTFTYTDAMHQTPRVSSPEVSRKRKISVESAEALRVPAKRTSNQQLRSNEAEPYDAQNYLQQPIPSYLPHPSLSVDASVGGLMPPYNRSQSQPGYQQQGSPRRLSQHLSTSSGSSISQMRNPSPQTPSWSPSNTTVHQPSKSPNLSAPSITRVSSASSPSNTGNPQLIRTSTLQQTPSPAATPSGSSGPATFNPYAMYPHKAVLKINGELDSMTTNWTKDELEAKRRLVQFWRSQSGSTINTTFKPVAPENRPTNSICISCIWWESKKEYYVTSVDTIYLLESLVAVRFTVEEKNRIRRNLEGFRPMTVSKGKSDSEDFFKLIMQFPNPKPRNIEKDVKVFPWKILAHALKKIISKYVSFFFLPSFLRLLIPCIPSSPATCSTPTHTHPCLHRMHAFVTIHTNRGEKTTVSQLFLHSRSLVHRCGAASASAPTPPIRSRPRPPPSRFPTTFSLLPPSTPPTTQWRLRPKLAICPVA